MSQFSSRSLSLTVEDPLIKTNRSFSDRLTSQVNSYSHDLRAIGGFWGASITINDQDEKIDDWIKNGLGRHIVVHNPNLKVIFEGFVDRIEARLGPLIFGLGPLTDIGNRVQTIFSTTNPAGSQETFGARAVTNATNDTASQTKFGIIQKLVSTAGATVPNAERIRDVWIAENAQPDTSRDLNLTGQAGPAVNLTIKGYWHWFKLYIYEDTTLGEQDLDIKMKAVINAQLNSIFSTGFSRITDNNTQVEQKDDRNRRAEAVLKELNSFGDSSSNRYNIGVYANRQVIYEAQPSTIAFQERITGNVGITDSLDGDIDPWNVTPTEWLFFPDFLTGSPVPSSLAQLKTDPRAGSIQTVRFSLPNNLTVNGVKLGQLDQVLTRLGLKGAAA